MYVMTDFDQRIQELEEALLDTETVIREKATMSNQEDTESRCIQYIYIVGIAIPLLTAGILYFLKPKFIKKKASKKINTNSLLMWVAIITIVGWVLLGVIKYYGYFDNKFCF